MVMALKSLNQPFYYLLFSLDNWTTFKGNKITFFWVDVHLQITEKIIHENLNYLKDYAIITSVSFRWTYCLVFRRWIYSICAYPNDKTNKQKIRSRQTPYVELYISHLFLELKKCYMSITEEIPSWMRCSWD